MDELPTACIMDIDGTCMDNEESNKHKEEIANDDWSWFEKMIPYFIPEPWAITLINNLASKHRIIFISARTENCRYKTEKWLKYWFEFKPYFPFRLLLRSDGDRRADHVLKASIFEENIVGRYNILFAIDDNAEVLKMWRKHKIPTLRAQY